MSRRIVPFEPHHKPLLPWPAFLRRVARSAGIGIGIVVLSLLVGMAGYHSLEGMSWVDSFANASMILSGMGPLAPLQTFNGKVFAGIYALYSGLALILIAGIIFAPIVHRLLHKFHLERQSRDS